MWYFSSASALQKMEKIQERALRFLYNDPFTSYNHLLLKSERCTMLASRLRVLCIKVFKTMNGINPFFMQGEGKLYTAERRGNTAFAIRKSAQGVQEITTMRSQLR